MKYVTIKNMRINLDQIASYIPYEEVQTILNESVIFYYITFRTHDIDSCFRIWFEGGEKERQEAMKLLDYYSSTKKDID